LRLAQGRVDLAYAAIRRVADEASGSLRCTVLAACVEITLAAGDVPEARRAADELGRIAAHLPAPFLQALAGGAHGAVLLAEADFRGSLVALGRAWTLWRELDVPFEAARVSVNIALACRALGDGDTAALELEFARRVFRELGAAIDLARVERLLLAPGSADPNPLTPREREVLGLVAAGKTNRAIAATLAISDKTVARHVSNIFGKLGLTSRAAATAYAYQQGLV
jgi:DNA-binding CsgD family transcriptional regulator